MENTTKQKIITACENSESLTTGREAYENYHSYSYAVKDNIITQTDHYYEPIYSTANIIINTTTILGNCDDLSFLDSL